MPARLSDDDWKHYQRLVGLLHSLEYGLTTRFLRDEKSRGKILNQLGYRVYELLEEFGCGDLCTDKEKGCVPCDYSNT